LINRSRALMGLPGRDYVMNPFCGMLFARSAVTDSLAPVAQ
jgi:hypothetical protein